MDLPTKTFSLGVPMETPPDTVLDVEVGGNLPIVEVITKIPETVWENIQTLFAGFIEVATDDEQDDPRFI